MTRKKLLGSQVKRLLSGVSGHGSQHLTEVELDLMQTTTLLSEAIGKLSASFMAIHEGVTAQQETVNLLMNGQAPSAENLTRLKEIHNEIGVHVNAAITGLQFQDMTSQLIERTIRRIIGLRQVLDTLGTNGSVVLPESDSKEIIALLKNINRILEEESRKLESVLWKAVAQTHMESGEVDLF